MAEPSTESAIVLPVDPLFGKTFAALGSRLLGYLKDPVKRRYAIWKAGRSGGSAASIGLTAIVEQELRSICVAGLSGSQLAQDTLTNWLMKPSQAERVAAVLVGISAGRSPQRYESAQNELASTYADVTGEDVRAATGPIRAVVDVVAAALKATESGQRKLSLALAVETVASVNDQHRDEGRSTQEPLERARLLSAALLATAERAWPAPAFVSPLALYLHSSKENGTRETITVEQLVAFAGRSERTALIGDGGVGKTTLLRKLGAATAALGDKVPLLFDAAAWAATRVQLFEYLAGRAEASSNGVTQQELWHLAKTGKLVLLINGWNEIAGAQRHRSVQELQSVEVAAPAVTWVLATRSLSDYPIDRNVTIFDVEGLRWKEQSQQIRARLSSRSADDLENLLAIDSSLRHAARRPLVLLGVIELAARGSIEHCTTLDFLATAVEQYEQHLPRRAVLDDATLDGYAMRYLEGIATAMVNDVATVADRERVLQAITGVARSLLKDALLTTPPRGNDVLAALTSHHLLQSDDGGVRFAHQLFQEFFAANALLKVLRHGDAVAEVLQSAVTAPGWAEALRLVSESLHRRRLTNERAMLVSLALQNDLGLACDLAGQSGFQADDDEATFRHCVQSIKHLAGSSFPEVRTLASSLMIASRWPCFANELWNLIEHADQHVRLTTYRQQEGGITLSQLGDDATSRIRAWESERQSEFIQESGRAHENFDFIRESAHSAADAVVRDAAISALLWNYPASPDGLRAWAGAQTGIQVAMLDHVSAALEGRDEPCEVATALTNLTSRLDDDGKVRFARNFPHRAPANFADAIADHLRRVGGNYPSEDVLLEVLERVSPGRAGEVAKQLTSGARTAPEWAARIVTSSPELADSVRDTLLNRLLTEPGQSLDAELLGRLADSTTTVQLLTLLPLANHDGGSGFDSQYNLVRRALIFSGGDGFLQGVLSQAQSGVGLAELGEQLSLLMLRTQPEQSSASPPLKWAPGITDVERLLRACESALEDELRESDQDEIRTSLCMLAATASCQHFMQFILGAASKHLDLWSGYRKRLSQTPAGESRSPNPYYGQRLTKALVACGLVVADELLAMTEHPESDTLIPETLALIAATQLPSEERPPFGDTVAAAITRGHRNRASGLPKDVRLDAIAAYFSGQLSRRTGVYAAETDAGKRRSLAWAVGTWAAMASKVPSELVVGPVVDALKSEALDVFKAVDVLRSLVSSGVRIEDRPALEQLDILLASKDSSWSGDSERYWIGELAGFFVCAVEDKYLPRTWQTYLALWLKYAYWHAVTGACRAGCCIRAWDVLERLLSDEGDASEMAFDAMVHLVDGDTLPRFANVIRRGVVSKDHVFYWRLGDRVPYIATLISARPGLKQLFVEACRASPNRAADGLAVKTLARVNLNEALHYFLNAMDLGRFDMGEWQGRELVSTFLFFRQDLDEGAYEISPASCNELRQALYKRVVAGAPSALVATRLLAEIECERREDGRPDAELRHPLRADGHQWMQIFESGATPA